MRNGHRIFVVVPAYREEALIGRTLDGIPAFVDRVIVVDDASDDATAALVLARGEERVRLVRHERNGGVGKAIATGYRVFLEETTAAEARAAFVVMAGDAQMDPADLPALLEAVREGGAGYAKGNRFRSREVLSAMPKGRLVGNLVFSLLTKLASGYWHVMDSQCGYTALTREAASRLDLDALYPRYGFPNDLLVKLNVAEIPVADVPVRAIYADERSGINPWVVVPRVLGLLARGFLHRLRRRYVARGPAGIATLYGLGLLTAPLPLFLALLGSERTAWSGASLATATLAFLFAIRADSRHNRALRAAP